MMYRIKDIDVVRQFTDDWNESVVKTCLAGRIGSVFADDERSPSCVLLTAGEFVLFAGAPGEEAVAYVPEGYKTDLAIMTAKGDDDRWYRLIEKVYGERAEKITRYAIKKDGVASFNRAKLTAMASSLPEGYRIEKIGRSLYDFCRTDGDFHDLVSQYPTYEEYEKYGLGFMAFYGDEAASGCSSFSDYPGGLEIEIATKESHRRRGLASAVAAKFILECIERNIYPSWDAANLSSVALAEKLGYRLDRAYTAYEVKEYRRGKK
ncbi:MAG: GNAT family N-acetyltransferase [Clostridia bacterium]|nr:GNAT family N-acetyltransferase [Clostridia bacterium]